MPKKPIAPVKRDHNGEIKATTRQRKFAEVFLLENSRVKAYKASCKHREDDPLLSRKATCVFNEPVVQALIQDAKMKTLAKIERESQAGLENAINKYGITQERVMAELAKIAFANVGDVSKWGPDGVTIFDSKTLDENAMSAVQEVSEVRSEKTGTSVKVKLYDKQTALINLGKHLGMFTEKVEHKGVLAVAAKFVIEGK